MIKLFIWDLDNTIIASSELLWGAFSWVAYKYLGKKPSPQEIVATYGPPESDIIEKMVGRELKAQALKDFYDFYLTHHDSKVKVFEPVVEVIRYLRKHTLQALFTSKGKKSAQITLEKTSMSSLFHVIVCGDEIPRPKPYPDGVNKILTILKASPEETIYLGDSPLDYKSARIAGVFFGMTLWDALFEVSSLRLKPHLRFEQPEDLQKWVRKMYP
ncbi:MAG: HAD family hydrolase [Candidatus Atribacteria bacterium]|nr:HAD family hydrolase [Candidatus Atribacteria bacterium]MCD6349933.1 HAD family hydrolase [Candidatus Atribacteria bacterium]